MVNALKRQIRWLLIPRNINPWERWHPLRRLVHWYSTRQINYHLNPELDRQIRKFQDHSSTPTKSIVRLALQTYLAEDDSRMSVDDTFRTFAIGTFKQLLFAGHDTTSSTMCYIFYLLSANPESLKRVREEHTQVFGSDLAERVRKLKEEPYLLNQIPYSIAVLKETMRLFPAGSSVRRGEPGFNVRDAEGRSYPTDGFLVWAISQPLHRDGDYWPQPDVFLPERWLVGPKDPLYPVKGAWRPFEYGPRNCIGQELAMMEIKIAMVLVLATFNIEVAYEEIDRRSSRKPKMVNGERAYQLTLNAPSLGLPCKIRPVQSTLGSIG